MALFTHDRSRRALRILAPALLFFSLSCAAEVDVEKLYVQANSDDYEERVEARQKLNELVSEGKAEPFARGLRSENAETRVQSILHLMVIKNDEAKKDLVGELELSRRFNVFYNPIRLVPVSTPSDSRIMIAHILLLKGGDPKAVQILSDTYGKEPDAEARTGTIYALGALADPATIPALRRGLRDRDLRVVKAALEGLGQLGVSDAADDLIRGLGEDDERVRVNCASALGGFQGKATAEALMGTARKDPSHKVRVAALGSLAYAGTLDVFEPLVAMLKDTGSDDDLKSLAASALQGITDQNFGRDAARWSRWYGQNRGKPARP